MKVYTNGNLIWTGPRAYFASNLDNLFLITGTGILMYINKNDIDLSSNNLKFINIKTNLPDILRNYKDGKFFYYHTNMVKNILYNKKKLYVSLVQKINKECYTNVIYRGDLNIKNIVFEEFYRFEKCKPFYSEYVAGNLSNYKDNKILLSIGDWETCEDFRWLDNNPKGFCAENGAQSIKTEFGKIFELNLETKKLNLISIGHDNPQGLSYNKKYDVIISTEHGPQGGDEININRSISIENIKNFGYPISSYGEHYGGPDPDDERYIEAPMLKSHEKYGFEEPTDYFVPSIGISDVENYKEKLFVASMGSNIEEGDLSLYTYSIDENLKLSNKKINKIYQRIRDIEVFNDHVFLFLESTGSIGIFPLKEIM